MPAPSSRGGSAGFQMLRQDLDIELTDKERGKREGWWYQIAHLGSDPRRHLPDRDECDGADSEDEGEDAPWLRGEELTKDANLKQGLTWGDDVDSDEERMRQIEERLDDRDRDKMVKTKPEHSMPIWFIVRELEANSFAQELTKDLMLYIPFLIMFVFYFLYGRKIEQAFYISLGYNNLLTGNEIPITKPYESALQSLGYDVIAEASGPFYDKSYADVANALDWHSWFEGVVLYYLFYPRDTPPCPTCPSFRTSEDSNPLVPLGTGSNILLGSLRVRTWRMPGDSCSVEDEYFSNPADEYMIEDTRNHVACMAEPDSSSMHGGSMPTTRETCRTTCMNTATCQAAAWIQWPNPNNDNLHNHCRLWSTRCNPVVKGWAKPPIGEPATVTLWSKAAYGLQKPRCFDMFMRTEASEEPYGPDYDPFRWKHQECGSIIGRRIMGRIDLWPCGGYVVDFPFNMSYNQALARGYYLRGEPEDPSQLKGYGQQGFIDNIATRLVVIEFFSYQPNLRNVFSSCKFYVEVAPGGTWFSNTNFRNFEVWSEEQLPTTIFDVFFMTFVLYFFAKFLWDWRKAYLKIRAKGGNCLESVFSFIFDFWNILDIANLFCFFIVFGFKIAWVLESDRVGFKLPGVGYSEDLDYIEWLYSSQLFANSLNSILTFLKFLKYVRLNQRFAVLGRTMELAAQNIFGIILIFFIVVLAYSVCANILFGNGIDGYRDISISFQSNLLLLLGDFDYDGLREENRFVAFIFFWSFVILGLFLLLNFIIAVLSDAFSNASSEKPSPDVFEQISRVLEDLKYQLCHPCQGMRARWNDVKLMKANIIRFHLSWWMLKMASDDRIIEKRHFRAQVRELQYELGITDQMGVRLLEASDLQPPTTMPDDEDGAFDPDRKPQGQKSPRAELAAIWEEPDSEEEEEEEAAELTELEEHQFDQDPLAYIESAVRETGPDAKIQDPERRLAYENFKFRDMKMTFQSSGWLKAHRVKPRRDSKRFKFWDDNRMPGEPEEWMRFTKADERILRNVWWDTILLWELHKNSEEADTDDRADLEEAAEKAGNRFLGVSHGAAGGQRDAKVLKEIEELKNEMDEGDGADAKEEEDEDRPPDPILDGEEYKHTLHYLLKPKSMETVSKMADHLDQVEINLARAVKGLAQLDKEVSGIYKTLVTPGVQELLVATERAAHAGTGIVDGAAAAAAAPPGGALT